MGIAQLGTELKDDDAALIADFLTSLTGNQFGIEYPVLPVEPARAPCSPASGTSLHPPWLTLRSLASRPR
jgi:hypothetical protein